MPQPIQTIIFILGSIAVIFGAYYATYWLARGSQKINRGRAIQVLDRFALAKDKFIAVISVYDKVYLVAFSTGAVTVLDILNPEDIPLPNFEATLTSQLETQIPAALLSKLGKKLPWVKNSNQEEDIRK